MNSDKKILITTVYNSENCGSFLQAWSLYRVLIQNGYEVAFRKRESRTSSHSFVLHLTNAAKDILKMRFAHAYYVIKEWFVFNKLHKQFRIEKRNSPFFNEAKVQIIGSDTLWNFEADYFRKMATVYLGQDFLPRPSITYAVSADNTSTELFSKTANSITGLRALNKYLVRDSHTADLVKTVFNKESEIVCDPTMLLDPSDFNILEKVAPPIGNYLLIYCFGDIASMKDEIASYAKQRGLKTVSFMSKREWCDYNVEENPQLMITYYKYANCVVSNTFHGTAFSMIYEKPFVVIDEGKNKVKELLQLYGQERRLIKSPGSVSVCLDSGYTDVDKHNFVLLKKQSLSLLLNTVNNEVNREA